MAEFQELIHVPEKQFIKEQLAPSSYILEASNGALNS
jgi:hypothetical protein